MAAFIIGQKKQQTQVFNQKGAMLPATIIYTGDCYLVGIRSIEKDGYEAVIVGFGTSTRQGKSVQGYLKKNSTTHSVKHLREIRIEKNNQLSLIREEGKEGVKYGEKNYYAGDQLTPTLLFKQGDMVDVTGISKGKGYQGVVRRHGFAGGPKTHGQSNRQRAPGSVGPNTTPGHVFRGTRMAGQTGSLQATVKNLEVIAVSETMLTVKGLVPGHVNSLVKVYAVNS